MTPDQARELNRVTVKAEAMQDNFTDAGLQGPEDQRPDADPTYIYNKRQNRSASSS
jgi:hypothetical protein